jgi:hypothetical protein
MSFPTECPRCASKLRLLDKYRDEAFTCPECGERFVAQAVRPSTKRGTSGRLVILLVIGGVLLLCAVCVFFVVIVRNFGGNASALIAGSQADDGDDGSVRVTVRHAWVGIPSYADILGQPSGGREQALNVLLDIANYTEARKIDYDGWAFRSRNVSLADDVGNAYSMVHFGGGTFALWIPAPGQGFSRQIDSSAIHPGTTLTDILVFERPIKAAKTLTLTLPRANFGGRGTIRLKIETSSLGDRDWPTDEAGRPKASTK